MTDRTIAEQLLDFKKRLNAFRADVCSLNWEDDDHFEIKGQRVNFLSSDKIRRNLAPLFVKHGIELYVEPMDATFIKEDMTWMVHTSITLEDIHSVHSNTYHSIGMGGVGKNAITIGNTNAFKNWVTPTYQLADGMEKDEIIASFTPMSKAEKDVVTSNVLSKGIKPDERSKPIEESLLPEEDVHITVSDGDETPPWETVVTRRTEPKSGFKIPAKYAPVIDMHMDMLEEGFKNGSVEQSTYVDLYAQFDAMNSDESVRTFIKAIKAHFA